MIKEKFVPPRVIYRPDDKKEERGIPGFEGVAVIAALIFISSFYRLKLKIRKG